MSQAHIYYNDTRRDATSRVGGSRHSFYGIVYCLVEYTITLHNTKHALSHLRRCVVCRTTFETRTKDKQIWSTNEKHTVGRDAKWLCNAPARVFNRLSSACSRKLSSSPHIFLRVGVELVVVVQGEKFEKAHVGRAERGGLLGRVTRTKCHGFEGDGGEGVART